MILLVAVIIILITLLGIVVFRFFTEDNVKKYTKVEEPEKQISRENEIKIEENIEEVLGQTIIEETVVDEIIEEVQEDIVVQENQIVEDVSSRSGKEIRYTEPVQENQIVEQTKSIVVQEPVQNGIPAEYMGYSVAGRIEIPKTGANLYILSKQSVGGMEIASCILCSTGALNISGNTIITGHNYRNGRLFSNNNNISIGDKIYITTVDNIRREYTVYDKFLTTPEDASFYIRDTSNGPEITLSSCSDDNIQRVVILAK